MKYLTATWFVLFVLYFYVPGSYAQGFRGLVPLESTCEDVRRILKVDNCKEPQTVLFLKDVWLTINFSTKENVAIDGFCYDALPANRISMIKVSVHHSIAIPDFEYPLDYLRGPEGDIDTMTYVNRDHGVTALVNLGRINTLIYSPSKEQREELGKKCGGSPCRCARK